MHDFGKLVYLDLQKTGSTFVSKFLNATCKTEAIKEVKHGRIRAAHTPDTFYFITVRHPVSQYGSLYRSGLEARGGLYRRLEMQGWNQLYKPDRKSFNDWLRFMLDPANAKLLGEGYHKLPANYNLGFLSFRYLMLSLADPLRALLRQRKNTDPVGAALNASIVDHVIRNEELNEGLVELATTIKPDLFDQEKVRAFIAESARVNASETSAEVVSEVDDDVYDTLAKKERVLFSFYGS